MRIRIQVLMIPIALFALSSCSDSKKDGSSSARPEIRVLFVGNSYTAANDLSGMVRLLAESHPDGPYIDVSSIAPGGARWEEHAANSSTLTSIDEGYNIVVLQDQSMQAIEVPDAAVPKLAATTLADHIKQAGSEGVLFMTWPREYAHKDHTIPISRYYRRHGDALAMPVSPVGLAFVRAQHARPQIRLYEADASHPSYAGSYLAACCLYSSLTNSSCIGLSPLGLDPDEAAFLQGIAWNSVRIESARPSDHLFIDLSNAPIQDVLAVGNSLAVGNATGPTGLDNDATQFGNGYLITPSRPTTGYHLANFTLEFDVYRDNWDDNLPLRQEVVSFTNIPFVVWFGGTDLVIECLLQTETGSEVAYFRLPCTGLADGWHNVRVHFSGRTFMIGLAHRQGEHLLEDGSWLPIEGEDTALVLGASIDGHWRFEGRLANVDLSTSNDPSLPKSIARMGLPSPLAAGSAIPSWLQKQALPRPYSHLLLPDNF